MYSKSSLVSLAALALLIGACSPTVQLQAPDKPIEINMTVNIKHEILVKVETVSYTHLATTQRRFA